MFIVHAKNGCRQKNVIQMPHCVGGNERQI